MNDQEQLAILRGMDTEMLANLIVGLRLQLRWTRAAEVAAKLAAIGEAELNDYRLFCLGMDAGDLLDDLLDSIRSPH